MCQLEPNTPSLTKAINATFKPGTFSYLLRFQESVKKVARSNREIEMGTKTVTEVRREAADSDPGPLNNYPLAREE